MSRTALVTGGAGFMGAHLVALLIRQGWEVTVLDDGSAAGRSNLAAVGVEPHVVAGDVADVETFQRLPGGPFDVLFHLAGSANVPRSVEEPTADFRVNLQGTLNALELLRHGAANRLVFPSTASVYRSGLSMPLREDSPVRASSPYGAAKLACEQYCAAYTSTYGVETVVLRFFNVYGPLMRRFAIHDFVRKLQQDPACLEVLGDGSQVREYLHVEDAARALLVAAEHGLSGEAYNAGTGHPITIADLARAVIAAMGLEARSRLVFTGRTWPGDVAAFYADTTKLAALGFSPAVPFSEGLRDTVRFLAGQGGA